MIITIANVISVAITIVVTFSINNDGDDDDDDNMMTTMMMVMMMMIICTISNTQIQNISDIRNIRSHISQTVFILLADVFHFPRLNTCNLILNGGIITTRNLPKLHMAIALFCYGSLATAG